ncbi:hypothetical protein MRX96_021353 [Rhipicephalus microplus]
MDIDRMKRKRAVVRTSTTKLLNDIATMEDDASLGELEEKINLLTLKEDSLKELDREIEIGVEDDALEEEIACSENYKEKINVARTKVQLMLQQYAETANILRSHLYVDDLVTGVDTLEQGKVLCQESSDILSQAGMRLHKWMSNDHDLVNFIEDGNVAKRNANAELPAATKDKTHWPTTGEQSPGAVECHLEERKVTVMPVISSPFEAVLKVEEFSSCSRVVRLTAWVRRFVNNCRRGKERKSGPLRAEEVIDAERYWLATTQGEAFSDDISNLKAQRPLHKGSPVLPLSPYLDGEGLMRVGGRLQFTDNHEETKHPIILPSTHPFTLLLIRKEHLTTLPPHHLPAEIPGGDAHISRRWKYRSAMAEGFWRRWRREYLLELRSAHLSRPTTSSDLKIDDLVLLKEDHLKRHMWKIARIKETFKGRDGRVRACSLKLSGGTVVKRPIQLLYPLEVDRQ